MRLLCIGNSFSQDATRFLHDLAVGANIDLTCVNLYIGGCSLKRHWEEYENGLENYDYELNGEKICKTALLPVLREGNWDAITLQQASHDSGLMETYQPYLDKLYALIKEEAPDARVYIHETWAYEQNSTHQAFPLYHCNQLEMYDALRGAYAAACAHIRALLIPSGEAVQLARSHAPFRFELGEQSLCRDGFHMHLLTGRYLLACVFLEALTGVNGKESSFLPTVEGRTLTKEEQSVLCACAHEVNQRYK